MGPEPCQPWHSKQGPGPEPNNKIGLEPVGFEPRIRIKFWPGPRIHMSFGPGPAGPEPRDHRRWYGDYGSGDRDGDDHADEDGDVVQHEGHFLGMGKARGHACSHA